MRGLELEGVGELAEGWTVKAAYTFTDTKVLAGANAGTSLKNVPEHSASLWRSHAFSGSLEGLTLGGGLRYTGSRWGDDANTTKLKAVALLDLGSSYEWENGLVGKLNISNVTDEAYVAGIGSFATYIGDGRNEQASLGYKW